MLNVTMNAEKNGVELRFDGKPAQTVLDALKEKGFRWSVKQKMWYAKQSNAIMEFVNSLSEEKTVTAASKKNDEDYDLWAMTRTDGIEDNYVKYRICDNREIAAIIRKHVRERFPMCKWSVKSDTNSISVELLESPFAKDSAELKAIAHYAYTFAQSYNYDNSDSMSDYFDVNFYGVYENDIISWKYEQTDAGEVERKMSEDFQAKQAAFEKAEQERQGREFEERMAQEEIRKAEAEKQAAERKARHEVIESAAEVVETSYFVIGCDKTSASKEDKLSGYTDDCDGQLEVGHSRQNCKISREVHFAPEVYEMFVNQLMDDYSFLSGKGGSATDDVRVNSMIDYQMMTREERETVEWYNTDCVAVFSGDDLKIVVNPEGYGYARYVYFVDEESHIEKEYKAQSGISEDEAKANAELAEELTKASESIIAENLLSDSWDSDGRGEYEQHMKDWIYSNDFPLSREIIRPIESEKLKSAMYRLLQEVKSLPEQFNRAGFVEGQKITIVRISDFGGLSVTRGYFKSFTVGNHAQYNNAVRLVYRPERKHNDYYVWFYRDVIIFDGWQEVPENLLWETVESNGLTVKKTIYHSCDMAQYDAVLNYFAERGIKPIVDNHDQY